MQTEVTVSDVAVDQVGTLLSNGVGNGANEIYSVSYYSISPGITFISAAVSSAPAASITALSFFRFTPPSTYLPYWLSEYSSILTTYPSVRPLASASALQRRRKRGE